MQFSLPSSISFFNGFQFNMESFVLVMYSSASLVLLLIYSILSSSSISPLVNFSIFVFLKGDVTVLVTI